MVLVTVAVLFRRADVTLETLHFRFVFCCATREHMALVTVAALFRRADETLDLLCIQAGGRSGNAYWQSDALASMAAEYKDIRPLVACSRQRMNAAQS